MIRSPAGKLWVCLVVWGLCILTGGCGASGSDGGGALAVGQSDVHADTTVATSPAGMAGSTIESAGDIEAALAYWAGFGVEGAIELLQFESLGQITNSSTVVVKVRAVGPGPELTLHGDPSVPEDVFTIRSLKVEVLEVLSGSLSESVITITGLSVPEGEPVEAPAVLFLRHHQDPLYLDPPDPAAVDDPESRQALIEQLAVWNEFTKDKYYLTNSQGVFVEGARGVEDPALSEGTPMAVSVEVAGLTMSQFRAAVREVAGHPELRITHGVCCDSPAGS